MATLEPHRMFYAELITSSVVLWEWLVAFNFREHQKDEPGFLILPETNSR
jgi:hypothetical protein